MAYDEQVFDTWTPLSYKNALHGVPDMTPRLTASWVEEHRRRLMAYLILRALLDNSSRWYLAETDAKKRQEHREYGDAALIVDTIMGAVLGDDQQIAVEGADAFDPALETAPEPDPNAPPDPAAPAPAGNTAEARAAAELQEWLQAWADSERLPLKMIEAERGAVSLGDGVYTLGWSGPKRRPRLRVFDAGFYFPVLDESGGNDDDYPRKIHIAWEYETKDERGQTETRIRRITWELVDLVELIDPTTGELPEGARVETVDDVPQVVRDYVWNDEPSRYACILSDGSWKLEPDKSLSDLGPSTARWNEDEDGVIYRRDLKIDFVPVVHLPNTPADAEHFGRSSLLYVAQILDDLSATDTDVNRARVTAAQPGFVLRGGALQGDPTFRPGQVWQVGDGTLEPIDTSRALAGLVVALDKMLDRLSVNARTPASLLGRVKPSEVPSGIALALSFGPLKQMVRQMRLVRDEKYPLLLKFVWRIARAAREADERVEVPETWTPAHVLLGSFLPEDVVSIVQNVATLFAAKLVSLETALTILQEAGIPIEDVAEEVRRIHATDFAGALELLEATGNVDAAGEYLGVEIEPLPEPPPTPPPGAPPPAGAPPAAPPPGGGS